MKKIITMLLLVSLLFVMVACDNNFVEKTSHNLDTYTIVMSYDHENRKVSATQSVKITNRWDEPVDCLKFHIYANQYREGAAWSVVTSGYRSKAYPNGESWGNITFDSVSCNGNSVAYVIEGQDMDILSVPISSLGPNETVTIDMTYEIQLANVLHRLGYGDNTVNLGNFYPILCVWEDGFQTTPYYNIGDPFVSRVANYDVTINAPSEFVVASSGNMEESTVTDGITSTRYTALSVRDFAMVLSDKFEVSTAEVGDVTVNYYHFADSDSNTTLQTAVGMLTYLSEKIGKYPYKVYNVAETDFCYGGMEYPNLVMVTSNSSQYLVATAHETAHQWFYGLVGNDQINFAWMDEGLVEFLTMLYMDSVEEGSLHTMIKSAFRNYTTFVDVLSQFGKLDVSLRPISQYKSDSEYVYMTYAKGSLLFYSLYQTMGETKFFNALKDYYNNCKLTIAHPEQMMHSFSRAFGSDMSGVFDSFVEGKDIIGQID